MTRSRNTEEKRDGSLVLHEPDRDEVIVMRLVTTLRSFNEFNSRTPLAKIASTLDAYYPLERLWP